VPREARDPAAGAVKKIAATGRTTPAAPAPERTRSTCPADPSHSVGRPPARRGVSLGLWAAGHADLPAWASARLDELVALGATDVALVAGWRQTDVAAVELAPGPDTPSDADLLAIAAAAKARGLEVTIFPLVLLDVTAPGKWRGTLAPRDVDAWWQAYEAFVLHHARLAAGAGATALVIGSELGSTETWRDRWYHLISRVEDAYDGALWYSANWDHYKHVSFWERLDAVGVTGYFELTRDAGAGVADLARAWTAKRDALLAFAGRHGLPLILTEVGYPSVDGGAARPWDYTARGKVDLEEQRRAFRALALAWGNVAFDGLFVWEWSGDGGAQDRGYSPRGKPAACELEMWWAPVTASSASGSAP
jgi:hypothetical protein